jgi:cytochrome c biogenesis protein CcmG, thiol:disulfide interchange protein DsbE
MRALGLSAVLCVVAVAGCGGDAPPPNAPTASATDSKDSKDSKDTKPADDKKDDKAGSSGGASSGGGGSKPSGAVKVGDSAPMFSIDSLNGQGKVALASGKVTVVDFWATWCEPCKKSFPKYQELYVKYKASGLEIAAVSVDDEKGSIPAFAKSHGAKFPVGWDNGKKIADQYKPENMPTAYVIDKNGVVKFVHKGYHDGEEKELEKEIKGLL